MREHFSYDGSSEPDDIIDAEWTQESQDSEDFRAEDLRAEDFRARGGFGAGAADGPMSYLLGPDGPFGKHGIFGPRGPLNADAIFGPGRRGRSGWEEFLSGAAELGEEVKRAKRDERGRRHDRGHRRHEHERHGQEGRGQERRGQERRGQERRGQERWEPRRGPGGPRPHGGRRRRGDVRLAALLLIAEEPRNGYQIIEELAQRTDGRWRPSSGAIYPALSQLEDEGLIEAFEKEGRRAYRLTEAGTAHVDELGDIPRPWDADAGAARRARASMGGAAGGNLWSALGQVGMAVHAVSQSGDEAVVGQAADLLAKAKQDLYRLLADGPQDAPAGSEAAATEGQGGGSAADAAGDAAGDAGPQDSTD